MKEQGISEVSEVARSEGTRNIGGIRSGSEVKTGTGLNSWMETNKQG